MGFNFNDLSRGTRCNWHHEARLSTTGSRKSPAPPTGSADMSRLVERLGQASLSDSSNGADNGVKPIRAIENTP
jgi:hypothetical protein